jgi:predicted dehydrogenase
MSSHELSSSPPPSHTPASASSSAGEGIDRRTLLKSLTAVGLAAAASACAETAAQGPAWREAPLLTSAPPQPLGRRRRYAIVGTGGRHNMFRRAILDAYKDHAELVGLCDRNPGRVDLARRDTAQRGINVPGYAHTDFDQMIRETKPDTVIVTTVDGTHHGYMIRAMELGCDVISEKPMTTTAEKCQQILDAKARTGKNVRVTFNYRYAPPRTQVKDLLMSGVIGDILSVDFHWLLNTTHGADYFRRWHSNKVNSGGLMIHKASHHFDLVNWWLGAVPVSVFATGKREFYTPTMARRLGLMSHHERCLTCPEKTKCTFYMDLAASNHKQLYLEQEKYDGYFRDKCVWRPDIDIEDTMNVTVRYNTGTTLSYSLNAFNAWEGYHVAFNGTKGRLEHSIVEDGKVFADNTVVGAAVAGGVSTRIIPMRSPARSVTPWSGQGGHGGGDEIMLRDIFVSPTAHEAPATTSGDVEFPEGSAPPIARATGPHDKYLRASDERAGAAAILVGVAANRCFVEKKPVEIGSLVSGLRMPVYAPMPGKGERVPMPPAVGAGSGGGIAPATQPATRAGAAPA